MGTGGKVAIGIGIAAVLGGGGYLLYRSREQARLAELDAKLPGSGSLEDKLKGLGVAGCKKLVASQGAGSLSGLCNYALLPQVLSKAPAVAKVAGKAVVSGGKAVASGAAGAAKTAASTVGKVAGKLKFW